MNILIYRQKDVRIVVLHKNYNLEGQSQIAAYKMFQWIKIPKYPALDR